MTKGRGGANGSGGASSTAGAGRGCPGANFASSTVWTGDNLPILRGMNSGCVDLIYLDPPFNSDADYSAPIGSEAAGAEFRDTWTLDDVDIAWIDLIEAKHPGLRRVLLAAQTDSDKSYLVYMAARLIEMRRVLKPTGSIYLHCDRTMSHYLKLVMDAIFGRGNYRNEIVWCYTGPGSPKMRQFNRKHDTIHWYSVGETWVFNADAVRIPHADGAPHSGGFLGGLDESAVREYSALGKVPESWWPQGKGNGLAIAARQKNQYVGYPTQKPLALLERIIAASSNPGDLVLDPFCGCATALVAADRLGRDWAGIDLSPLAVELVNRRIAKDRAATKEKSVIGGNLWGGALQREAPPQRTDQGKIPRYNSLENRKYLYGEQGGQCAGCRVHFKPRHLEVDHIIARAQNGGDHIENLQLLCGACNRVKGNRGMEYLKARLQIG